MKACLSRQRNGKGQFFGPAAVIPHPDERFDEMYVVDPSGCYIWIAGQSMGYGTFWANGKKIRAHVYAFERKYGPVPKGKVLDHVVCDRRLCVNPDHLRVCTVTENILRSPLTNANKETCPQGHPYDDENTYRNGKGRNCRTCHREQERNRKIRIRSQAMEVQIETS